MDEKAPFEPPVAQARIPKPGLKAKIDMLVDEHDRQLSPSAMCSPDERSAEIRKHFVTKVWPLVEGDYKMMLDLLRPLIEDRLEASGLQGKVTGRVKSDQEGSITRTLVRREREFNVRYTSFRDVFCEMHDLVGVRLVLQSRDDLAKSVDFVEAEFDHLKDTAHISANRDVGVFWKERFGAYESINHRVCLKSGSTVNRVTADVWDALSWYKGVMFEVQVTYWSKMVYNIIAHPVLYKQRFGDLSRPIEQILDVVGGTLTSLSVTVELLFDLLSASAQQRAIHGQLGAPAEKLNLKSEEKREATLLELSKYGSDVMSNVEELIEKRMQDLAVEMPSDPRREQECFRDCKLKLNRIMTLLNGTETQVVTQPQEHQELLDWLTPPALDSRIGEQHCHRLRRRVEGTGSWFPQHVEFAAWVSESQTTLYCLGIPGAGKSILSSVAICHLLDLQKSSLDEEIGVGYLLCDFKSTDEPEDLLGSLLKQIVRPGEAPSDLRDLFQRYKSRPRGSRPLINELVGCLNTVINSYSRVFVVIDALDEYDTSSRAELLEAVFQLQRTTKLSLLATLRPIQEITSLFEDSGITLRVIEVQANDEDVRAFLGYKMAQGPFMRKMSADVKKGIVSDIVDASKGMFLLAELYLKSILRYRNVNGVRKAVRDLPAGRDAYKILYADTMGRIQNKETRDLAMQVLSWVAWAKRPLTIREMQHALIIADGDMTLDNDNTTDEEAIISACEGLVRLDGNTFIRLNHYTTREYLEGVRDGFFPTVENDILGVCVELLSNYSFETGRCPTDAEFEARMQRYPLYEYAVKHWGQHAHIGNNKPEILNFLQKGPNVDAASQCLFTYKTFSQSVPKHTTGLHLAVWFGLKSIAKDLLSKGFYSAREHNSYGQSALSIAAAHGYLNIVQLLLAHTVQVDMPDKIGRTPLSLAAEAGHLKVVQHLASRGADCDAGDIFKRTPLSYAAEGGHEAVVKYLLTRASVAVGRPDYAGRSPLFRAALARQWGAVRLLASNGARVDPRDNEGDYPITLAAKNGYKEDVVTLIEIGAHLNSRDAEGRTALSHAAEHSCFDLTTHLLSAGGADASIADEDGWTPFIWASESGWDAGLEMLLAQCGRACAAHQDRHGQTALAIASRMGHKAAVQELLRWDTDRITVNIPDHTGWTPLIQAAKDGGDVLGLLLDEAGTSIDVSWKDCAGKTALHWAAAAGHLRAAIRLMDAAAPLDMEDNLQRTPLWLAARNGHEAVAAALLRGHAKVDCVDRLRRTPLRIAAEAGHEKVVQTLLGWNAELELDPHAHEITLHLVSLVASLEVQRLLEEGAMGDPGAVDSLGLVALFLR